ncbi:MAG TPA: hypothetical protein VN650_10120 [Gemmatimonadaceae bacterium]|nr:hypothetical protein [Gemmatimonadaceae bacterium]
MLKRRNEQQLSSRFTSSRTWSMAVRSYTNSKLTPSRRWERNDSLFSLPIQANLFA